jgi:Tfp pilus assembly protein PilV
MRKRLALRSDQGETLLELLISIVILGVCVVAIGSSITLSILISDVHRKQSLASEFLHNNAETIQASAYQPCTGTVNYATGLPVPPNGGPWTVTQKKVQFWNGTSFTSTCPTVLGAPKDMGLEQVTLRLQSSDQTVDETLDVIVRNPSAT